MIQRVKKNKNYSTISNVGLCDENLSLKAKGLYAFLLSKPDSWEITSAGLQAQLKEGRDGINSAINELKKFGYVQVVQSRRKDGTFKSETTLFENPVKSVNRYGKTVDGEPVTGKPVTVEPLTVNPQQVSTNKVSTERVSTESNNSTNVELAKAEFGKPEINEMFAYWKQATGSTITGQKNRNACYNLVRKHGTVNMQKIINLVAEAQTRKYAPVITDFSSLQAKWNDLEVWVKRERINQSVTKVRVIS